MRIFRDIYNLPKFNNAVITIGSYDGVHKGHQKIIRRINNLARQVNGESVLVTFDPHPRMVIYPKDKSLELLSTLDEKIELCEKANVDNLVIVPFSIEFSQQPPEEYIEKFIIDKFNPAYVVIGYDHRFGMNRKGDIHLLQTYEAQDHFKLVEIPKQELQEITISSTKIRNALKAGNVNKANQFLNYNYKLTGVVAHGDKIGQTIGFPTANVEIEEPTKLIPRDGVYAVRCDIEGLQKEGMMYIGPRPTVNKTTKKKIEVNIFDFDGIIYNKPIEVEVFHFLRGEERFDSLDALKEQLAKDKISAMSLLSGTSYTSPRQDRVCIAILNYNGNHYLESYLPQVLHSSEYPINITVIDNDSSDDSVEYLEEWHPEVDIIQLSKNYGFADGYNNGLKKVDTEYTVILNSDIDVPKYWLDPILELMDKNKDISIVQPKILSLEEKDSFEYAGASGGFIDSLGYPYCRGRIFDILEKDHLQYENRINIDWASGAAMVVRTEVFKQLGGFDGDYFAHMEEIDFCIRARRAGHKIVVEPKSVVYHLGGGTLDYGNPRKVYLNFRNSLYTLFKNESSSALCWKIPTRLVLDGIAGMKFLTEGKISSIGAIIKAHWAFFTAIPALIKKRKRLRQLISKNKVAEEVKRSTHTTFILVDFYLKNKKSFDKLG